MVWNKEDWIIYGGPDFLAVVWFGSTPTPSPLSLEQHVFLSHSFSVSPVQDGKGGWRGRAWSRIIQPQKKPGPQSFLVWKKSTLYCTVDYLSFNLSFHCVAWRVRGWSQIRWILLLPFSTYVCYQKNLNDCAQFFVCFNSLHKRKIQVHAVVL